ncbi:GGDEF domain-containing protein [Caldimonas sp.]|uniref:GGDEF domain-containing protein n=1 Tax=Caldimonas sp. TaxID=2838790 RepID=UPI00307DCE4E
MNVFYNLTIAQYWGLLLALCVLSLIILALLAVLRHESRHIRGPGHWLAAVALMMVGTGLAGVAVAQAQGVWVWMYAPASAIQLLGIGLFGEGLRRHQGLPSRAATVVMLSVLAMLVLLGLMASGRQYGAVSSMSLFAGLAWARFVWLSVRFRRPGYGAIRFGLVASGLFLLLGWTVRGVVLLHAGPTAWRELISLANIGLIFFSFIGAGMLGLLLVLLINFRLAERLRSMALRDALTGAINRRGFEERAARLVALSAQMGQSVTVLMLDIDHFKRVNDEHGHAVGDLVLKALAQLVHRAKRETDLFARLGGEEFCLVLPGTDVPGARVFAERLRHSFEVLEIDTGSRFLRCTMSIGVAYASAAMLQSKRVDLVDLLHQADEALYEAKRAGRNRLRFYASPEVVSSRLDSRLFATTGLSSGFGPSSLVWGDSSGVQ